MSTILDIIAWIIVWTVRIALILVAVGIVGSVCWFVPEVAIPIGTAIVIFALYFWASERRWAKKCWGNWKNGR
jgi:hypothetical protein